VSGLKSAWEISLEKSDKLNPELKNRKKLTKEQKAEIAEIRTETKAAIADKDVSLDYKIKKLADRVPPESLESEKETLKKEFNDIKEKLEEEMEKKIEAIYQQNQ
jgi:dGTP triphosphohydrolase